MFERYIYSEKSFHIKKTRKLKKWENSSITCLGFNKNYMGEISKSIKKRVYETYPGF